MNILHILDHSIPLHSGYSFRTKNILIEQGNIGWNTFQITGPKHNVAANIRDEFENIDGLAFYRSNELFYMASKIPVVGQWATIQSLINRLKEVIKDVKPDILHAHSPFLNCSAALNVGKSYGIPVVYEIRAFWEDAAVDHGTHKENSIRYKLMRSAESKMIREANAVTTICEGLRSDIVNRGIPDEKVTVIPNSIDPLFFSKKVSEENLKRKLEIEGKVVIGFIGSFYAYEGLHLLIKSFSELIKTQTNVVLVLIGGGDEYDALGKEINRCKLNKSVKLLGRLPHQEIANYYGMMDICVYPRLRMRLTDLVTPLKPLEAMASRSLVVGSDVGGHKELIRPGETGELFEAGNHHDLTSTLHNLLENQESWRRYLDNAYEYVAKERTWESSVRRYEKIYKSLVS